MECGKNDDGVTPPGPAVAIRHATGKVHRPGIFAIAGGEMLVDALLTQPSYKSVYRPVWVDARHRLR
jgi:hypothetical protein